MSGLFSFCKDLFSSTKKRTFSSINETEEDKNRSNKKQCTESNETEEDRSNKNQTEEDENRSTDSEPVQAKYQRIRGNSSERSSVELLLDNALRCGNEKDIMFYTSVLRQQNELNYQTTNRFLMNL